MDITRTTEPPRVMLFHKALDDGIPGIRPLSGATRIPADFFGLVEQRGSGARRVITEERFLKAYDRQTRA